MVRTIKKRAMSLLLALAIIFSAFAGVEIIGVRASAEGTLTWAQINNAISWAIPLAENQAKSWVTYDRAWNPWECESYGNCPQFVRSAFVAGAGHDPDISVYNPTDWWGMWTQNRHITAEAPPKGALAFYDLVFHGENTGHIALSLGDGRVICGGDSTVRITSYNDSFWGTYKGWSTWRDMNMPEAEPMTPPTQSFDKEAYFVGDTVTVTWTPSSPNSGIQCYWLELKKEGFAETIASWRVDGTVSSYIFYVSEPGNYTLYICADRGDMQLPSTVGTISVYQSLKPEVTITPNGGSFTDTQTITIAATPSEFTKIYYTTDGTTPTASSTEYKGAFTVSKDTTVKAYAVNTLVPTYRSEVVSATFTKITTPHTHNWGEWTITKEPTAAEMGMAMHICFADNPHTEYVKIPNLTSSIWTVRTVAEPTCTAGGSQECTSIYGTVTVSLPKSEHTWGDWTIIPATEAAEAYRKRNCNVCGELQTDSVTHVNHVLEKREAVAPTCTQTGRIEFWVCSLCNMKFADASGTMEIIDITAPAKGHGWDNGEVTAPATTTSEGVKTYTCTVCGETRTESIPKLTGGDPDTPDIHTHTYSTDWSYDDTYHWHAATCGHTTEQTDKAEHTRISEITKAPTCTEKGIKTYKCSVCGKLLGTEDIAATGHKWDGGKVTTPATTKAEGVKTYTCTVCGTARTESIPKLPVSSGGGSSGGSGSSGSGSSSSSGGSTRPSGITSTATEETVTVNGVAQNWTKAVTTINSAANDSTATISGSTDIPADVIAAAAKKNVKLEVKANDTFTWMIDAAKAGEGAKNLSVSDSAITATNKTIKSGETSKDFRVTESKLGTGSSLRYNAGKANSGKFANLFKVNGSALEFVAVVKVDVAGSALLPITAAGTYKIVISGETKLVGDLNNSMDLNALDAAMMLKKLADGDISADEAAKFDFNGDGKANALDAAAILKWINK